VPKSKTAPAISASRSPNSSLPRIPLVPDDLLKRNNVLCTLDTRFRRAARLLQCLWLKDHNIPTDTTVRGETATVIGFASNLHPDAADAGKNFLTPAIHQFVLRELVLREEGAAIDEDRLFANALSSMPLTFNLFGPLALDPDLATAVFRRLLPEFVHTVEHIAFEHSPGRRESRFLLDGTAFDLAVRITTPDGESATIFIEVKYSEDMMGPAARIRDRYDEAARAVHLYNDPESPLLRSLALEQLWREHMLAQLAVDHGITSRAVFVAIGPRLNRRVMTAFRVYQNELIHLEHQDTDRAGFEPITLETFVDAINAAGATELALSLWRRYLDFERVYELSLQEIGCQPLPNSAKESPSAPEKSTTPPLLDRSRRVTSSRASRPHRQTTNAAASATPTDAREFWPDAAATNSAIAFSTSLE
jgi:hypothetical protein